jgi:copper-binding protein NosD
MTSIAVGNRFRCALGITVLGTIFVLCAGRAMAATNCTFTTSGSTQRLNADCTTDATIFIPNGFTLDGAGHTITAVDPPGDHWKGAVVRSNGPRANVRRLTISASALQDVCDVGPGAFGEDRLRGIAFYGASGSISNNRIVGLNQGAGSTCNEGTAILVENAPFDGTHPNTRRVTVEENEIVDAQTYGIAAQGDVDVTVKDNNVDLSSAVGAISQYGISVSAGAAGRVQENAVGAGYQDGNVSFPTGILIYETSGAFVGGNRISRVQEGIFVLSYCIRIPSANRNNIVGNWLSGVFEGVVLVARSYGGPGSASLCDAHVDRNLVSLNTIKAEPQVTPLTGVFYGRQVLSGSFNPVADRNVVTLNYIVGYQNPLFDAGSTNTIVFANVIK